MTRAGIYVRISRDYAGEGRAVARQEHDCRELVDRLGWDVVEVYTDNDVSATKRTRPAYKRLLDDLSAGRLDAVVCWHMDRLYRRAVDLGELVEVVQKHGVKVATVKAGDVDLSSPTGLLVAEMLAAIAMYEVRHKTERWVGSFRQGREEGRVYRTGSRLFGYDRDMRVIEAEAAIAQRMAADVIAGTNLTQIANQLEADGIVATRGNAWRPMGIRIYLSNPKLAGYSTLRGEIVGEGQWAAILDRDTWETCRAMLAARARAERPPRVALLGGLLFCGRCGHRLITGGYKKGKPTSTRTYRCPNRPGLRGCGRVSGNAEPIEAIVEEYAKARLLEAPAVHAGVEAVRRVDGSGELLAEVQQLEQRIRELDSELDRPGVPVARLANALERAQTRLGELQAELAAALSTAHAVQAHASYTGGLAWPSDLATRRMLVTTALGGARVFLDPASGRRNLDGFDVGRVRIGGEQGTR